MMVASIASEGTVWCVWFNVPVRLTDIIEASEIEHADDSLQMIYRAR